MSAQPIPGAGRRTENLALAFQELLTVGERLRSHRQAVSDAGTFRQQIWEGVRGATTEAARQGYSGEDIELATFAAVAFLDESILNQRDPVFVDWPRLPLQEERYGHHIAGDIFFQNLQKLLTRPETDDVADVLEVYYLCLLLGFAGRYSMGGRGDLKAVMDSVGDKIRRIRRGPSVLSPRGGLPANEPEIPQGDSSARRILLAVLAACAVTLILFIAYHFALGSGISELRSLAAVAIVSCWPGHA